MKKYNYDDLDEYIYEEKLKNGLKVYYYPKENAKNFYISITIPYGAKVCKYKKNNKLYDIIPGTAHFLEHRLIDFSVDKKAYNEIDALGSFPNAYTSYFVTNYNIYGSVNINKNIELLLDKVLSPVFTDRDIKKEIGVINEEIDMTNDDVEYAMSFKETENIYHNCYLKTPILGTKESIGKITANYLSRIYNDMYDLNKMAIVITGGFNLEQVSSFVNKYFDGYKFKKSKNIKLINERDKDSVKVSYEETQLKVSNTNVRISYKIPIKEMKFVKSTDIKRYINLLLNMNFSSTSKIYEELKSNDVFHFGFSVNKVNNYIIILFSAVTNNTDYFINKVDYTLNNLTVDSNTLERKKSVIIAFDVMSFEDFVFVEDIIVNNLINYKHFNSNVKNSIKNVNVAMMQNIVDKLDIANRSVLVVKSNDKN